MSAARAAFNEFFRATGDILFNQQSKTHDIQVIITQRKERKGNLMKEMLEPVNV